MVGFILMLFSLFGVIYFLGQIDLTYMEDEAEDFWKSKDGENDLRDSKKGADECQDNYFKIAGKNNFHNDRYFGSSYKSQF